VGVYKPLRQEADIGIATPRFYELRDLGDHQVPLRRSPDERGVGYLVCVRRSGVKESGGAT